MGEVGLSNPMRYYLVGQTIEIPDGIRVTEIRQGTDDYAAGDGKYIEVYWTDDTSVTGGNSER